MALTNAVQPSDSSHVPRDPYPILPPAPVTATTPVGDPWPRPYYLDRGLRRVAPYHFTYDTYCKQRWRGRTILDIFAVEFRDRTSEYYANAIESGAIVINGKPCWKTDTIVKNGDLISHTLHRHEPPVSAQNIGIIAETNSMIVIDKPAGVPVHPAGRYKFNSVVEIMRAERSSAFNPLPCNRLDRLTSGVMFIGKTSKEAEIISQQLRGRTVRKEYVARVKGRFPDGEGWDGDPMRGGIVMCDEGILQISPILGLNRARASGKSAKTLFRRIAYYPPKSTKVDAGSTVSNAGTRENNTDNKAIAPPLPSTEDQGYSIVHALPLTGRTHQIRVHLQFLGHPITNDPIYSNRRVFGPSLGKLDASGKDDEGIIERLSHMGKTELADAVSYGSDSNSVPSTSKPQQHSESNAPQTDGSRRPDSGIDLGSLVDQTRQMTVSEAQRLASAMNSSPEHEQKTPSEKTTKRQPSPIRDPTDWKELPAGTLHAGPLPIPITTEKANSTTKTTNATTSTPDATHRTNPADPFSSEVTLDAATSAAYIKAHEEMVADYNARKGEKLTGERCTICDTALYSDPAPHELGIYLHAFAYSDTGGKWRYASAPPSWAQPPNVEKDTGKDAEEQEGKFQIPPWDMAATPAEMLELPDGGVEGEKRYERKKNLEGEVRNKSAHKNQNLAANGDGRGAGPDAIPDLLSQSMCGKVDTVVPEDS